MSGKNKVFKQTKGYMNSEGIRLKGSEMFYNTEKGEEDWGDVGQEPEEDPKEVFEQAFLRLGIQWEVGWTWNELVGKKIAVQWTDGDGEYEPKILYWHIFTKKLVKHCLKPQ